MRLIDRTLTRGRRVIVVGALEHAGLSGEDAGEVLGRAGI